MKTYRFTSVEIEFKRLPHRAQFLIPLGGLHVSQRIGGVSMRRCGVRGVI